jgi:hypothetical protein
MMCPLAADMGLASKCEDVDREAFGSREVYRTGSNVDGLCLVRWGPRTWLAVAVEPSCLEVGVGVELQEQVARRLEALLDFYFCEIALECRCYKDRSACPACQGPVPR